MLCTDIVFNVRTKTQFLYTLCCELVFFNEFNELNNLLSCCRLTDARMRASEKDLPAQNRCLAINIYTYNGL